MCVQIIDGFSPKILPDPPEQARLAAEDNKSETWQECTWKAILDPKAPQELIQAGAKVGVCDGWSGGKGAQVGALFSEGIKVVMRRATLLVAFDF